MAEGSSHTLEDSGTPPARRSAGLASGGAAAARAAAAIAPALILFAIQQVFFPAPAGVVVRGVIIGGLSALVAVGMALIYRSNRILNFAQADLGVLPVAFVYLLITFSGFNYLLALGIGIVSSALLGAVVELVIIRRFFRSPRLILTVATIGLSQLLAFTALVLPRWWDATILRPRIDPPFDFHFTIEPIVFDANSLLAIIIVPLALLAIVVFLRWTSAGIAVRASAESADRAALLGVPVKRLQTLVWTIAALLAFVATFLRASILGLPFGSILSYGILLRSLAALMLGKLDNMPRVAASAVALGVLEVGVSWGDWRFIPTPSYANSPSLLDPVLALVIITALLVQRRGGARVDQSDATSWQAAEEVRPVPRELRRVTEVRVVRAATAVVVGGFLLVLPHLLHREGQRAEASAVLIYGIVAISLVVLTGWAGQVSLGQIAFFAVGAVVGAIATSQWHVDLVLALLVSATVGGATAVVVGLPALRHRGLYLAVTSFAFSLATTSFLLNPQYFSWVPRQGRRIPRPELFGSIDISSETSMYYVVLAGLAVVVIAVRGVRRSRTGRVIVAMRENERAAQSFGASAVRVKLTAFAMSGALAAFAGGLFVHHQQAIGEQPYEPGQNLFVFSMAVIGGIGSVPGALLGALYLEGARWFLPSQWRGFASAVGVLLVLLVLPGGLGGLTYRLRDLWLRSVARRRSVVVPSLLADSRVEPPVLEHPPDAEAEVEPAMTAGPP
jgi:branched-chain amino acid transport system permease protein